MLKRYCISAEGLDKAGKGLVLQYLTILGKYKYVLMDRGLLSNIVYARLNDREYDYDIAQFKNWTIVYLTVDKEDWEVRCKLSNEPKIDYEQHLKIFNKTVAELEKAGISILKYNTSIDTPYSIAKSIIQHMENNN